MQPSVTQEGNDFGSLTKLLDKPTTSGIYDSANKGWRSTLNAKVSDFKFAQVRDIRGPSTDGPTAGVYQWMQPAPAMAPLPGPHPNIGQTKAAHQM
jgi:hypothetical protein